MNKKIIKLIRYAYIYGPGRTLVKTVARTRLGLPLPRLLAPFRFNKKKDIGLIGCGQFAFATIAFYITKKFGARIGYCLDVNQLATSHISKCYEIDRSNVGAIDEKDLENIKMVYIASNHSTHTDYAIDFLKRGIDVHIEKPISVSRQQLAQLREQIVQSQGKVYFGYNRPFSKAIKELKALIRPHPITLNCIVIGHLLQSDHWYKNSAEGTRICGNLGHWIDLAFHLINFRGGAKKFEISMTYSDPVPSSENLTVVITTEMRDLVTLTLSAREEPFEGVNETIIFQQENLFVKIDDFRKASFLVGHKKWVRTYWPKDVGHSAAILQPYNQEERSIPEVLSSTELMLNIMEMSQKGETRGIFQIQ